MDITNPKIEDDELEIYTDDEMIDITSMLYNLLLKSKKKILKEKKLDNIIINSNIYKRFLSINDGEIKSDNIKIYTLAFMMMTKHIC